VSRDNNQAYPPDGTLHPLTLPNLDPVPSTVMSPLRGVVSIILDDNELDWNPDSDDKSAEMTVIVVRRKGLGIYKLATRLIPQKVCHLMGFTDARKYPYPLLLPTLRYSPPISAQLSLRPGHIVSST
jgi:hypothetical protein